MASACLQAVPVNVVSPFPVNTPNMLCSHSGGKGTKEVGGDVKQDQSWGLPPLLVFLRDFTLGKFPSWLIYGQDQGSTG